MPNRISLALVILVCTGFASAQTTITLRPTGDGSVKQWNANGGGTCTSTTCYSQVNESSGSTNCTSSSYVPGSGVYNKSPATASRVEQYTLTLTSIPDDSIIDSITVHACEARGGGTSTAGTLRIVVNGNTTACGSNQSVTATYQDLSCTFSSLNVTKGGGTTVEIGNSTTQTRAIWMDSIEAEVTYRQQAAGGVAASMHTSPVVTGEVYAAQAKNGVGSASVAFDPPCCITTGYPLGATVHVSPSITAYRTTNYNACCIQESLTTVLACSTCVSKFFDAASFHISPSVAAAQGRGKSVSVSAHVSPAVVTHTGLHGTIAVSLHTSPALTNVQHGTAGLTESFLTSTTVGAVSSGSGPKSVGVTTGFGIGTQLGESAQTSSGLSQSAHFSPAVGAKANVSEATTATIVLNASVEVLVRQPKSKYVVLVTH